MLNFRKKIMYIGVSGIVITKTFGASQGMLYNYLKSDEIVAHFTDVCLV